MRLVPTPLYAAALGVSLTALEARQTTAAAGWQWRPWLPVSAAGRVLTPADWHCRVLLPWPYLTDLAIPGRFQGSSR